MKNTLFYIFLFISSGLFAQDFPAPPSPPRIVNDFVGVLSSQELNALEQKLVAFDDTTSSQIAVVIVKTVKPLDMSSYALQLGRKWGVGQKGKNNGIVLLWATEDRKVELAVAYGLEGAIPDGIAYRIVNQEILPYFKRSEWYNGLNSGTDAIIKYASGEYKAEPEEAGEFPIWGFVIMLIILYFIFRSMKNNGGGNIGGGKYRSGWPYTTYTGWGNHSGNWGGGGGGFGGGGGGGGGFGGFGGGSFGGGGAGGSY
ncbi:uncharacterized protein SAMN06298216_0890 [Spirosomataceae bacterium TFI 002]|nr:uncharacterized protein SAMN06298216_0890 [Spirosomataceae bacterium TFI 002]